ncbi:MAG: nucleotidyltransferase domain-containing protein [Cyanobacteria bacterium J06559_1]
MNEQRMVSSAQLYKRLGVSPAELEAFCDCTPITELAFFGSVLQDTFHPDSDIDILIVLAPNHGMGLFDFFALEDQFKELFQRDVDLLEKEMAEKDHNWIRRQEILNNTQVVYESRRILSA